MTKRPLIALIASVLLTSCSNATGPSRAGYAGQWRGTTAQGAPISFVISPDNAVTSITVGHSFNGCTGTQTFANLSISIVPDVMCIPGPCPGSLTSFRQFDHSTGNPFEDTRT